MEYEDRVSRVLCRILKRLGLEAASTNNYRDFKSLVNEYAPRFILLSLDSPTNNQGELCNYLVEQKTRATIILLSNMDEEKLLGFERNGRNAGLNMGGILRKPIDLNSVQNKLEELITPDQGNSFKKKVPCGRNIGRIDHIKIMDTKQPVLNVIFDLDHEIIISKTVEYPIGILGDFRKSFPADALFPAEFDRRIT
jgi:DNA-binding response OmpR family regulator